jgi:hypothetical protein
MRFEIRNATLVADETTMSAVPENSALTLWRTTSLYRTAGGALLWVQQNRSSAEHDDDLRLHVASSVEELVESLIDSEGGLTETDAQLLRSAGYDVSLDE